MTQGSQSARGGALPNAMRAWRVEQLGAVALRDVPLPVPDAGQYLVRVEAAGLAFGDTLLVRGTYQIKPPLPFTPGSEVVGVIVNSGGPLATGTRVAGVSRLGGFAEYALMSCEDAVPIDAQLPAGIALALRGNFPTALYALRQAARLCKGETLLVHAGAGGVGGAAVQLGKLMEARVIALAGGERKVQACRNLGADVALDAGDPGWVDAVKALAPQGVDVIFDPVGGETGVSSMRCLAHRARYLVIGFAGGALTQLPANRLLLHNASAIGVLWGDVVRRDRALATELNQQVFAWHAEGRLQPPHGPTYAFEQANEALSLLEGRGSTGKVVLRVGHSA